MATSALSSLEAMLVSLMGGSGGGGGSEENTPVDDDGLPSPPLPPLPARPTPRGRHPSRYTTIVRAAAAGSWTTPPSPSKEDASTTTDGDDSLVAELERKAAEVEARLQHKEEENAELKRRLESYHVEWLKCEIKIKSLEEACQEQMAALQAVQDAKTRADETPRDRGESLESLMKMSEEPASAAARRHRAGGRRSSAVSRLGSEFRRQSQALDHGVTAAALAVMERPWQPAVPSANSVDELKKLKAQFRAWNKDYKARLRRAKAELDRDRRNRGGCWI
ncbi:hypothetical protein PR202_gb06278 [Eleusine coracana subsp. coracana]|uniref:Uncharacterized protein n=1 Tax=Eleusine coracana subsp. coracana TaxID=191504 RepID=A0AAV5E9W6_ELECO|nr:hypothetical protein QOZ80_2BG0155590 [Eleusine coracana subsp. coracana]GJN19045.1 hypothetical protein PR202_gb06278 [Eleusine coracana subsp. coracana]